MDPAVAGADGTWFRGDRAYEAGTPATATFVPAGHYRALLFLAETPGMEPWSGQR